MKNTYLVLLVFSVAFIVSLLVYPRVLKHAKKHNIVDNPNARKLQRVPVPVMGGLVVYLGFLAGGLVLSMFMHTPVMAWGLLGITVMMIIGVWDDISDLSAMLRLLIEILIVAVFIGVTDFYIDDLHGLWDVHELPTWMGITLSMVTGVGLINAVNLIDGVDGYSSGFGLLACLCFGLVFWNVWSPVMVCMSVAVMGAIIPFFMHNVFGRRSKMFIGDGGTLMLGMLMTVFVLYSLSSKSHCGRVERQGLSLVAFSLAVMNIPVFDTLRVMTMRIFRGVSPFRPDKTHLHHLFIDMGFSHLGAALFILFLNAMVVGICLLLWQLGASFEVQTYVVIGLGMLVTFGFYKFMKVQQNGGPKDEEGYPLGTEVWHAFCRFGDWTHRENKRSWKVLEYIMDGPMSKG